MPPKKPPEFGPTKILQRAYEQGIRAITGRVLLGAPKKPEQTFSQWIAALAAKSQEPDIQAASERLAKRMVFFVQKSNYKTWREAASRTTKARQLYEALQYEMQGATGPRVTQLVRENARLISSLPLEAATVLNNEILKAQQTGARPKTLAKLAQTRFPELIRSRIHLIARTETAKASSALTHARCERLNIQWYQWETSLDGDRVRESHRNMHNVIVSWSQTPSPEALVGEKSTLGPYNAGEAPNCRCLIIPILTLDDVQFPARVYWNGSINRMTKQQFKAVAIGLEERTTA